MEADVGTVELSQLKSYLSVGMALFLVIALEGSANEIDAAINRKVPAQEAYAIEPGKWVIEANQVTSKAVSDMLGLTATASRVTVPVGGYFGRARPELWEWLAAKAAPKVNA